MCVLPRTLPGAVSPILAELGSAARVSMNVPVWLCIVVGIVLVVLAWSVVSLLALALALHRAAENTVLATRDNFVDSTGAEGQL